MFKVTAISKALTGPRDQIIRSGSRHFGHYDKGRMIATFLIGPSTVCCGWFMCFTQMTSGYATDGMIHSDYQGQDERQKGMLTLIIIIIITSYAPISSKIKLSGATKPRG